MRLYDIKVSDDEISDVLARAQDALDEGGARFSGLSYEEGVLAAIDWMTGSSDSDPMEE